MNPIDETIAEFGRSLGITDLRLRASGGVVLAVQSIGTLAIDVAGPTQDSVVVSLSKPLARPAELDGRRLLGFAHHRTRPRLPVQLGAFRGQIVLAVVLPQAEFTLLKINEVIHVLDQQHQSMEASL
jgi:type III secretion system chaperone SycN